MVVFCNSQIPHNNKYVVMHSLNISISMTSKNDSYKNQNQLGYKDLKNFFYKQYAQNLTFYQ